MAAPDAPLNYVHAELMDEILLQTMEYLEGARQSDKRALDVWLKLAARCMREALEIHGDWLANQVRKEGVNEHV